MEDTISDTEALKLIQSSYDGSKPKESEDKLNDVNKFILDEENQDQLVDPFTYKLMNYEVIIYPSILIYNICSMLIRFIFFS